ncbi:alpha/beta hydrolase [Rothia aerolata]|uniref:Esterase n=1 Tax=Rothia aerolata TaxID=1812262 RepID=A0A917IJJ2_9MICC|nr:alpha/beta fold hydrolase [Rothia aerolata]GGH56402.1 esterase [Rothia aerolata]
MSETATEHSLPSDINHEPLSAAGSKKIGIVVVHGFTGSPWSVRPVAEFFAEQGYAVEMPRLPGHGTRWQDMVETTYLQWLDEVDRAYWRLKADGHDVVLFGLSMGGGLAIRESIRREVAGTILVNPFVQDPTPALRFAKIASRFSLTTEGITSDIAKPGVDEGGYLRVPLKAAHQLHRLGQDTRPMLGALKNPVLYFRSDQDHVVSDSSHRYFMKKVQSPIEFVSLNRSYHVATLDYDAPVILEKSLEFVRELESR